MDYELLNFLNLDDPIHAELQQLVDSLGSFASQQSSLPAANEGGQDEPWIIRSSRNDWRASHRNDGLRIRQLEL